jgi:hypothetical protein
VPDYSSPARATQVTAGIVPGDNKKFFEVAAVSTVPGAVVDTVKAAAREKGPKGTEKHSYRNQIVSEFAVHYDTAANLELRGILTREAHPELAHLLPAEPQEEPRRAAPQRKRDPLPDTEHHTVVDLVRSLCGHLASLTDSLRWTTTM